MVHPGGLLACHDCDLLNREVEVPEGGALRCARCGSVLYRHKRDSLDRTLALTLAALVLFVVANVFPFLAFDMGGNITQTTLITGVDQLWAQGWYLISALVFLTATGAPALQISLILDLPVPLNREDEQRLAKALEIYRLYVEDDSKFQVRAAAAAGGGGG